MRLVWPLMLLGLLIVPLTAIGYVLLERRRTKYAIHFTNIEVLAAVADGAPRWRRFVPAVLAALALTFALTALARPEIERSVASEQASIALTVDVSGSMEAEDVKPTRLEAAQGAIERFLEKVPKKYRVGLVTFSGEPFVATPLTHDRELVLESLRFGMTFGRGTAIGDALARSVELVQPLALDGDLPAAGGSSTPSTESDGPLAAILLLSDGAQTRGFLTPLQGAARAKSYGIPVYAVALGTPEGVIERQGFTRPVPPDPVTLRQIAEQTGGEFYEIRDEDRLNEVYEDLASRLGRQREWQEASFAFMGLAALLALAAGGLSLLWSQRLP